MELTSYLQFMLIGLCMLSGTVFIIFALKSSEDDIDYDKIISELNKQKKQDLETLNKRNKEIDIIERKILNCKKLLHFKLFEDNNLK